MSARRKDVAFYIKPRRQPSKEQREMIRRRIMPFLDINGMGRSIDLLMSEAYMQGLQDAVDAIGGASTSNQRTALAGISLPPPPKDGETK